jgi:hypothetical protein
MSIEKTILKISDEGGEEFILARDEKHAESMRVTAFNMRRRMPTIIQEEIGIQKFFENERFFLRIFKRGIDDAEHWRRDPSTGKLIPVPAAASDPNLIRMTELMRKDGKTEEEILEALKEITE